MATSSIQQKPTAVAYKHIGDGLPVYFDLYVPATMSGEERLPTVIFFHIGGLHAGNKDLIPAWLKQRCLSLGCAFISANYQLLPPASGHDIIQDIQDLFAFLAKAEISVDQQVFRADVNRIAVTGSSSGGHCAYLAGMHVSPKPKAIVGIYSPGGNFLMPHYVKEKTAPFMMGRPLVNPADFADFIYPFPDGPLPPTSDVPLVFGGPLTSRRPAMAGLYLQLGVYLDYLTGQHEPSLSASLRAIFDRNGSVEELKAAIPEQHRRLFPQLAVDGNWPPTLMMHGTADTGVLPEESDHLYSLLKGANVTAELLKIPGVEHVFDMPPGAEAKWGKEFDAVKDFLAKHLLAI